MSEEPQDGVIEMLRGIVATLGDHSARLGGIVDAQAVQAVGLGDMAARLGGIMDAQAVRLGDMAATLEDHSNQLGLLDMLAHSLSEFREARMTVDKRERTQ